MAKEQNSDGEQQEEKEKEEKIPKTLEEKLMAKFRLRDVEWVIVNAYDYMRNGTHEAKAYAKPYIKKESAERRADEVLGTLNWKNDHSMPDNAGRFKYKLEIRKDSDSPWVPKHDGGSIDQNAKGGFADNAFETALSFSEKRAWAKFGIGRYLKLVPQVQVQVSMDWKEGWNRYSFRSNIDNNKRTTIYWRAPQLPEWAMHPEDEYEDRPNPGDNPNPPTQTEPATDEQWNELTMFYSNLPEKGKDSWYQYLYEDQVDDETGEVIGSERRELTEEYAEKLLVNMRNRYGNLNDDGVPEKIAAYRAKQEEEKQEQQQPTPPPNSEKK